LLTRPQMRSELVNIDNAEFAGAVTTHQQLQSVLANETNRLTVTAEAGVMVVV
jgi:hypothetical protein